MKKSFGGMAVASGEVERDPLVTFFMFDGVQPPKYMMEMVTKNRFELPDFFRKMKEEKDTEGANFHYIFPPKTDLSHLDLSDLTFSGALMLDVNLSYTNLKYAQLARARLDRANLNHADLSFALATDVNFLEADFTGASLDRADLMQSTFSEAVFAKATLRAANVREAVGITWAMLESAQSYEGLIYNKTKGFLKDVSKGVKALRRPEYGKS